MYFSRLRRSIVSQASTILLLATGCHFCDKGQQDQVACQQEAGDSSAGQCEETLNCKKPPNGYVYEQEKEPRKARRNAKKDAKINADGCSPECERYPLLKRIADKENQESDIEVIKVAAKIKHEEEMCQQKIKAVKYLGTIGCCCYDKDGKVADALLEAMNDCLPPVRLAAVQAIAGCVCGQAYNRSCCNDEIAERLQEMAYKYDKNGCPVEPEPLIRQWAAYAAQNCKKKVTGTDTEKPDPEPSKEVKPDDKSETSPQALGPSEPTPLTSEATPEQNTNAQETSAQLGYAPRKLETNTFSYLQNHAAICNPAATVASEEMTLVGYSRTNIGPAVVVAVPEVEAAEYAVTLLTEESVAATVTVVESDVDSPFEAKLESFSQNEQVEAAPQQISEVVAVETAPVQPAVQFVAPVQRPAATPQGPAHKAARTTLQGNIESVDFANDVAVIRLPQNNPAAVNSRVHVVHQYALGRLQSIGEFEVVNSTAGSATIRPVAGSSLRKISVGDAATVY